MDRRIVGRLTRPWLACLAAACLIFQAVTSSFALGACLLTAPGDEPHGAVYAEHLDEKERHHSGGHEHGTTPDCCFSACHFLAGKIAPTPAFLVAAPEAAHSGLIAPEEDRRGRRGDWHLPQNPRAPPPRA